MNVCFGIGAFLGPILGASVFTSYHNWRAPMIVFGLVGFLMIALIALTVRPWFSETCRVVTVQTNHQGADTLLNRNTIMLDSAECNRRPRSLWLYRNVRDISTRGNSLHTATGWICRELVRVGALASLAGGWIGDRFSPRLVLSTAFFAIAVVGYLCFHSSGAVVRQAILTCAYGVLGSGIIYVNLAGYHVKAVQTNLASRASGMFVTSLYLSAAGAGYLMGGIASGPGWATAGFVQISLLSVIAGVLALGLRPDQMDLNVTSQARGWRTVRDFGHSPVPNETR